MTKTMDAAIGNIVVTALTSGNGKNFRTHGMANLTIITAAGATATYSSVDSDQATAHSAITATVSASSKGVIVCDWPFMRVSVAGGDCRIAVMP